MFDQQKVKKDTMPAVFVAVLCAVGRSSEFPAGWNGLAPRPPLAWRSYNAQVAAPGMPMDQDSIRGNVDALVDQSRVVDGVPTSLWDIGYQTAGIDGGYAKCVLKSTGAPCPASLKNDGECTMHDAGGNPMINTDAFRDLKGLVDHAHSRDVKMGFYQNNCDCPEKTEELINYEGDVKALLTLGFDGAKYDRCGVMLNSTLYAELMKAAGKPFLIENCHWGICDSGDDSSCPGKPSRSWAPFNFFRTSGDIRETWNSWVRNLLTATRFLDPRDPLSGPHAWAYPDMLQVGHLATAAHDRAHYGGWAIVSAPLYLSFDLRNATRLDRAWPVITNREVIAVNQQWSGHPGRLVRSWTPLAPKGEDSPLYLVTADLNSCQQGWTYSAATGQVELRQKDCLTQACGCVAAPTERGEAFPCNMVGGHQQSFDSDARYCDDATLRVVSCDPTDPAQRFAFGGNAAAGISGLLSANVSGAVMHVRPQPWYEGAGVQLDVVDPRRVLFSAGGILKTPGNNLASDTCLNASPTFNNGAALLLWAKPQPRGAVAVYLLNNHPTESFTNVTFTTSEVGFMQAPGRRGGEAEIRDIWLRKDIGLTKSGIVTLDLKARDTHFLLLQRP